MGIQLKTIKLSVLALAACMAMGCTEPEEPGKDFPPAKEKTPGEQLIGVWKFLITNPMESSQYTFGSDGGYQSVSVWGADTHSFAGTYRVIDTMVHIILQKDGRPLEEIRLRFTIKNDSMTMCKGVSLLGESAALVGEWKTTASVPDSAGLFRVYSYTFTAEGLMLSAYPGMVDTSGYTVVGHVIKVHDPVTGKDKMNMGYEIVEGRLSLYNLDTEMQLYRIK